MLRLGYVPGASPGKWARVWRERLPEVRLDLVQVEAAAAVAALEGGEIDAAIARLPVDKARFSAIPLYEEVPVVVVSRDHLLAATEDDETLSPDDLSGDVVFLAEDDVLYQHGTTPPGLRPVAYAADGTIDSGALAPRPATTAEAIAWVATGAGVTIVPMSLARLHHRRDVIYRLLTDGPLAPVGLVWVSDHKTDLIEELIGIVRGRTVNSSRGRSAAPLVATKPHRPAATAKGRRSRPAARTQRGRRP